MGGTTLAEAVETARRLAGEGIRSSLYFTGEYVSDPEKVRRTAERKRAAAEALADEGLDVHVSVDPTQIGHLLSRKAMVENARSIAGAIGAAARRKPTPGVDLLMLDMEDERLVDDTIGLYRELRARDLPAGLTLQAYLRRTESDLGDLLGSSGGIRLVKGAFAAGPEVAFTGRRRIRESFVRLSRLLLSPRSKAAGVYPAFATHDRALIDEVIRLARSRGWASAEYEIEMLHGVRPDLQRELVREGRRLRVYLPFGPDWWPYAARRIGESPRDAGLLLRAAGSLLRPT